MAVSYTHLDVYKRQHRARGLTPDAPVLRGAAQNPDTFFQAREACNQFYTCLLYTSRCVIRDRFLAWLLPVGTVIVLAIAATLDHLSRH